MFLARLAASAARLQSAARKTAEIRADPAPGRAKRPVHCGPATCERYGKIPSDTTAQPQEAGAFFPLPP